MDSLAGSASANEADGATAKGCESEKDTGFATCEHAAGLGISIVRDQGVWSDGVCEGGLAGPVRVALQADAFAQSILLAQLCKLVRPLPRLQRRRQDCLRRAETTAELVRAKCRQTLVTPTEP